MAEDIAQDLECYGMKGVDTPVLNSLAEEGLKYMNCYSTNPICSPNRTAMMTGTNQLLIGGENHRSNRNTPLRDPYKPFTYYLREAGYTCILGYSEVLSRGRKIDCNFKHQPLGDWEGEYGLFDKYDEFLPEDAPFFAQIQLRVTHRGDWWQEGRENSPSPVDPEEVELPPYLSDDPIVRMDWARYLDQIEYMDREIGVIIDDLKKKGLYDNTVILFIGDNGRCNIRGKGFLFDIGLRVPLIMHGPKGLFEPAVKEDLVSTTDITATILDLAGIEVPGFMTGQSVLAEDFNREYVLSTRDRWDEVIDRSRSLTGKSGLRYVRNDMLGVPYDAHHNYQEFYRPALHVMRALNLDGRLDEAQLQFFAPSKPKEQFFDLNTDPHELVNLIDDPAYAEQIALYREEIEKLERAYSYPEAEDDMGPLNLSYILDFVKYKFPEEYDRMLAGEEIGFIKYKNLYKEHLESLNAE